MSNETLESVNDLEILENIWRRQDAEEILVENMTDEEFYSYREKMYGIPAPNKNK